MVFDLLSCRFPIAEERVFSRLGMVVTRQVSVAQAGL